MGGPLCFGEIGLRYMGPYDGQLHRSWHRDRPHWMQHPLRMDYIQLMVYLTDVDESTHCISFSPESIDEPILEDQQAQLACGGVYDLHGPAGTCALFNVAALHTATTRPTRSERKTVHRSIMVTEARAPLSNDSGIPATLWRDHSLTWRRGLSMGFSTDERNYIWPRLDAERSFQTGLISRQRSRISTWRRTLAAEIASGLPVRMASKMSPYSAFMLPKKLNSGVNDSSFHGSVSLL